MTSPLNWRDIALAVALAVLAIVVALPDDWPVWSTNIALIGFALLVVLAILADILDRNPERSTRAKSKLGAAFQRLKLVRWRSPIFVEQPGLPPVNPGRQEVTFADIAGSTEHQLRQAEARLTQHLDVMRYGSRIFRGGLDPLSPLEMVFYQRGAVELLPFVREAGEAMGAFLMGVLHEMWAFPEEDARYWLAHFLHAELAPRLKATRERLENQVGQGVDSREALAGFYYQYERSFRAISRIEKGKFLTKDLAAIEAGKDFKKPHDQFIEALRKQLELPQFKALKQWLYSIKPDEYWSV
jgi:hypothetical protein